MAQKRRSKAVQRKKRVDREHGRSRIVGGREHRDHRTYGQVRRRHAEWSRMTRINVAPDVWIEFRELCQRKGIAASDELGELVTLQVAMVRIRGEGP